MGKSSNSHFKIVSHITKNEFNEQHANPDCSYRMDKPHHQIGTFYPVNSDFDSHRIFSITQYISVKIYIELSSLILKFDFPTLRFCQLIGMIL